MMSVKLSSMFLVFCLVLQSAICNPINIVKRQTAAEHAMGLAMDHSGDVGKPHGHIGINGIGHDLDNYNAHADAGVGMDVFESNNGRHSVGVGADYQESFAGVQGQNFRSGQEVGAGVGYEYNNGPHTFSAGTGVSRTFNRPFGGGHSKPNWNAGVNYKFRF